MNPQEVRILSDKMRAQELIIREQERRIVSLQTEVATLILERNKRVHADTGNTLMQFYQNMVKDGHIGSFVRGHMSGHHQLSYENDSDSITPEAPLNLKMQRGDDPDSIMPDAPVNLKKTTLHLGRPEVSAADIDSLKSAPKKRVRRKKNSPEVAFQQPLRVHMTDGERSPEIAMRNQRSDILSEMITERFRGPKPFQLPATAPADTSQSAQKTPKQKNVRKANYDCAECGKECISKQRLDSHMRVHSDARPFQCDLCGKAFKHQPNLIVHKKRLHPECMAAPPVPAGQYTATPIARSLSTLKKRARLDSVLKKITSSSTSDSDGHSSSGGPGVESFQFRQSPQQLVFASSEEDSLDLE